MENLPSVTTPHSSSDSNAAESLYHHHLNCIINQVEEFDKAIPLEEIYLWHQSVFSALTEQLSHPNAKEMLRIQNEAFVHLLKLNELVRKTSLISHKMIEQIPLDIFDLKELDKSV